MGPKVGEAARIRIALGKFAQSSRLLMLVDERGRDRLAACGSVQQCPAGTVIVRQGEVGDAFYLIVGGEVRVLVAESRSVPPREAARLHGGQFFGEIAVLTRQPRSATVEAVEESELIRFEREPVAAVLNDYPMVREIIGSVGLRRSEANLESRAGEPVGLSELLEGDEEPAAGADSEGEVSDRLDHEVAGQSANELGGELESGLEDELEDKKDRRDD